jgi:hypothetical protein
MDVLKSSSIDAQINILKWFSAKELFILMVSYKFIYSLIFNKKFWICYCQHRGNFSMEIHNYDPLKLIIYSLGTSSSGVIKIKDLLFYFEILLLKFSNSNIYVQNNSFIVGSNSLLINRYDNLIIRNSHSYFCPYTLRAFYDIIQNEKIIYTKRVKKINSNMDVYIQDDPYLKPIKSIEIKKDKIYLMI